MFLNSCYVIYLMQVEQDFILQFGEDVAAKFLERLVQTLYYYYL